jgi:hypothetical protein
MATCINGMGYLKALDAEEKRFSLSGEALFKDRGCHNFPTLLADLDVESFLAVT